MFRKNTLNKLYTCSCSQANLKLKSRKKNPDQGHFCRSFSLYLLDHWFFDVSIEVVGGYGGRFDSPSSTVLFNLARTKFPIAVVLPEPLFPRISRSD